MSVSSSTQQRVLQAACRVFAEKGYRDATIAEICDAAEANIAAVNYYFGDKLNLYFECFRYLFKICSKIYPAPDVNMPDPERWIRGFVRSRILNILDDGEAGLLPRLMHYEMGQPTEIHFRLHEELISRHYQNVADKVRHFLGSQTTADELQIAMINLSSLHIFINIGQQHASKTAPTDEPHPCAINVTMDRNVIAEQVENYAIGGLTATRALLQSRKAHS
ncbi:MAG: CerR family C-terminal domain-containing protein [Pontiellaceae bacterium]|nr:CerR family C-terminal domain-containing protein [Pontiellaceae bacterium]